MNTLTMTRRDYLVDTVYNEDTRNWDMYFSNRKTHDMECQKSMTKIDLEILRMNAMRIVEAIDKAIGDA